MILLKNHQEEIKVHLKAKINHIMNHIKIIDKIIDSEIKCLWILKIIFLYIKIIYIYFILYIKT